MITKIVTRNKSIDTYYASVELVGLSTDTKPTNERNGSLFLEMDTGKVFVYDEANTQWLEL